MDNLLTYFPLLLSGLWLTMALMILSVAFSLLLATTMTFISNTGCKPIKKIIDILIFFVRGTPLLVQIFLIYYGAGQFEWIRDSWAWVILKSPFSCAVLVLSLNSACYTTVLFLGAINSVPKNEIDACHAMGMSKWLAFYRIIFPRAFRLALPAYSNEVIMVLKSTSLASTITLLELMGVTQQLISQTYDTVTLYLCAGVIYLCLNALITVIFKLLINWGKLPQQSDS